MKVRYLKTFTDEFKCTLEPGWVAEHTEPEGTRRIALGVCERVDDNTRAFRYKLNAPLAIDLCVDDSVKPSEAEAQKETFKPGLVLKNK